MTGRSVLRFLPLSLAVCVTLVSGCATMNPFHSYSAAAYTLALDHGFDNEVIESGPFTLVCFSHIRKPGGPLRVYIEGDGFAWESRNRLSRDPTPRDPIGLRLAVLDPADNVVYLGRPGQYVSEPSKRCDPSYWSQDRFAPEVIEAMDNAIERYRSRSASREVELVGYSGGGAIAVLISAKRSDVANLRTIGGNLDHEAVNRFHRVSRLTGSLNAITVAKKIAAIPQIHFVGARDTVVPPAVAEAFVKESGAGSRGKIVIVPGATHTQGWVKRWPEFLKVAF